MSTRADRITPASRAPEVLSDFDASLRLNPVTADVSRFTNEAAAAQAIKYAMLTANGEWPFEPDNGTAVSRSLFGPLDDVTLSNIQSTVELAFKNRCSSFAILRGVSVSTGADPRFVDVAITYSLALSPSSSATVRVVLKRAR